MSSPMALCELASHITIVLHYYVLLCTIMHYYSAVLLSIVLHYYAAQKCSPVLLDFAGQLVTEDIVCQQACMPTSRIVDSLDSSP